MGAIFTQLLHVLAVLSRHLQGDYTIISLRHTVIKYVAINMHIMWYQQCKNIQVFVNIMYVNTTLVEH